jgi:menaquinone-dependent protoporphyrinogen IX oxidase
MSSSVDIGARPRVLFAYYSHTNQALRVADVMAETLRARGCEVTEAAVEFTEPKYLDRFSRFPFRHAVWDILPLAIPQLLRKTGRIEVPPELKSGDYDLVVLGSPTWFFMTNMPLRSYLKSDDAKAILADKPFAIYVVCRRYWSLNFKEAKKLATAQGGKFVDRTKFTYEGGQVRSLLALLSYFGKGEMRERSLGIEIPPTNLKPDFGNEASAFANTLADSLGLPAETGERPLSAVSR